mmetsp:Transcript_32145/g.70661  ORF Transcript_32145/g.70661 Transcript_32145/m.70661 type:complete len:235 (+) Transcript_32145:364-1068(+)
MKRLQSAELPKGLANDTLGGLLLAANIGSEHVNHGVDDILGILKADRTAAALGHLGANLGLLLVGELGPFQRLRVLRLEHHIGSRRRGSAAISGRHVGQGWSHSHLVHTHGNGRYVRLIVPIAILVDVLAGKVDLLPLKVRVLLHLLLPQGGSRSLLLRSADVLLHLQLRFGLLHLGRIRLRHSGDVASVGHVVLGLAIRLNLALLGGLAIHNEEDLARILFGLLVFNALLLGD